LKVWGKDKRLSPKK